jgi:hypothetical protein
MRYRRFAGNAALLRRIDVRQAASLLLLILVLLGSCSTTPQNLGCECNPHVKEWLEAFEAGHLSVEQCLTLIKGRLDVQKMEALKLTGISRANGMRALARETGKKVDNRLAGEEE